MHSTLNKKSAQKQKELLKNNGYSQAVVLFYESETYINNGLDCICFRMSRRYNTPHGQECYEY